MAAIKHPEQSPNETFVGNTDASEGVPAHLRGLRTARVGTYALCIDGKRIPTDQMLPLFVGDVDAAEYDRIMMARFRAIRGNTHC
jgi:hypothetical protein